MTARQRIHAFLRTLSRRHRAFGVAHALAPHALVWALGLVIVDLVLPRWFWASVGAAALVLALAALRAVRRSRARVAATDRELRLQDRLLTYLGLGEREHATAMADWLERDLDDRLRSVPPQRAAGVGWRPLGPVRYLIPILIVILLVRLFAPALPPIKPRGPQANAPNSGAPPQPDDGDREDQDQQPDNEDSQPDEQPAPQDQPPPPGQGPVPPPAPPEGEDSEGRPPRPLIDGLEEEQAFVVPDFIGDGESRRSKAHVAVIPQGSGGGADKTAGGAAGGRDRDEPERDFEKARERALHARRVPEHERPFVKRYFEALVRREK